VSARSRPAQAFGEIMEKRGFIMDKWEGRFCFSSDRLDEFTLQAYDYVISHIPPIVLELVNKTRHSESIDTIDHKDPVVHQVFNKLTNEQKRVVTGIIGNGGKGFNFSEMGMGKTIMSICLSIYYGGNQVIVCPASLVQNWIDEYKRFTGLHNIVSYDTKQGRIPNGILVSSYSKLKSLRTSKRNNLLVILDESHNIKNRAAIRSKAAIHVCARAKYIICLSGTPMSKPSDLFTQCRVLYPEVFRFFTKYPQPASVTTLNNTNLFLFGDRYCDPTRVYTGYNRYAYQYNGSTFPWELHSIISSFTWRITKRVMSIQLPPKHRRQINVGVCPTQLQQQLTEVKQIRDKYGTRPGNTALTNILHATSQIKLPFIIQYIERLVANGDVKKHKHLLFAHFKKTINAVQSCLEQLGIKHIIITGETSVAKRQTLVNVFQSDHSYRVALLSISAAGVGLNLFSASRVVFMELIWNDKDMIQAEDRAHRKGQTSVVVVTYLSLPQSIDELIWQSIVKKQNIASIVVDNAPKLLNIQLS
jgi:SWI/SNF-related matrix-associated actin-dependent regulator 1 of chromatin subfamily A